MKKILHITNHPGTKRNIENVCKYLNIYEQLETQGYIHPMFLDVNDANTLWETMDYKNKLKEYETLIFTDTSMVARPFLQHMEEHDCRIIIYVTNRVDWGMRHFLNTSYEVLYNDFMNLYRRMSHKYKDRIYFCADNRYDLYYTEKFGIYFKFEEYTPLTPYLYIEDCTRCVSSPNIENKFFIYNRGSDIENYIHFLNEQQIEYDIFDKQMGKPYQDERQIAKYKGYIHLPYQTNIQSLWENLGYNILYFIPSKRFFLSLLNEKWYYWEEKKMSMQDLYKSIELSEWYNPKNIDLFEMFDSWEDLGEKNKKPAEYWITKKLKIRQIMLEKNKMSISMWREMLME